MVSTPTFCDGVMAESTATCRRGAYDALGGTRCDSRGGNWSGGSGCGWLRG
jgi:hypothetical protein